MARCIKWMATTCFHIYVYPCQMARRNLGLTKIRFSHPAFSLDQTLTVLWNLDLEGSTIWAYAQHMGAALMDGTFKCCKVDLRPCGAQPSLKFFWSWPTQMANLKELPCKSMQKICHVLGLEHIPFNLWQEMKISYPWSQSLPTRLLRSVMNNYLGDPSSRVCDLLWPAIKSIQNSGNWQGWIRSQSFCANLFWVSDRNMRANTAQNPGNRTQHPQQKLKSLPWDNLEGCGQTAKISRKLQKNAFDWSSKYSSEDSEGYH